MEKESSSSSELLSEPLAKKARFACVSYEDVSWALNASVPATTKHSTEFWNRVFNDFCSEQKTPVDLATCSPRDLGETLSNFYVGFRKKDGGLYMRASYLAARAAVSRYMVQTLQRPDCNLYRQPEFRRSNMVLDGVLKEKKRSGCEPQVEHKDSIAAGDLAKIMSYFENVLESGDAVKLAQYCWFNLSLHFALRGAEVQLKLSKSDIVFGVDSDGKEYATISRDFLSKNCQGGVQGLEFQTRGRLQEPRQVAALRKLLGKLHPQVERLFQRALQGHQPETKETWFMRSPLGHTIIRDMIPRLCKAAGVERRHTNHSMRATSIYALKRAGFEDRVVCELTGHKNPKSLESYCRATEEEKRSMASILDGGSAPASSRPEPGTSKSHTVSPSSMSAPDASSSSAEAMNGTLFIAGGNPVFNNLTINIEQKS